jgi:hypothetical protein
VILTGDRNCAGFRSICILELANERVDGSVSSHEPDHQEDRERYSEQPKESIASHAASLMSDFFNGFHTHTSLPSQKLDANCFRGSGLHREGKQPHLFGGAIEH